MAFTHALSTNNYGAAKLIVATSAANGTHTTLASALADASVGDTVFLRDSVTENVTIPAGVNIASWQGSSLNVPSVTGTITMTAAGTSTISGLRLVTNSAPLITVSGSAASILQVKRCYLNISNNTGISFTSSDAGAAINFENCQGDVSTTGIAVYSMTSAGQMNFEWCFITNSGTSVTASSNSAGVVQMLWSPWQSPVSTTSTGRVNFEHCNCQSSNTAFLTTAGSGTNGVIGCGINSGSASAISIGTGTTVNVTRSTNVTSSNTNAITGAGTLGYSPITFSGSSSTVNTTTQTPLPIGPFITSAGQAAFIFKLLNSTAANLTGDGTVYVIGTDALTNVAQNGSAMATNGTFTAPVSGFYFFQIALYPYGLLVGHTSCDIFLRVGGSNLYDLTHCNPFNYASSGEGVFTSSTIVQLAATNTVTWTLTVTGGTKVVGIGGATGGYFRTYISGHLIC